MLSIIYSDVSLCRWQVSKGQKQEACQDILQMRGLATEIAEDSRPQRIPRAPGLLLAQVQECKTLHRLVAPLA